MDNELFPGGSLNMTTLLSSGDSQAAGCPGPCTLHVSDKNDIDIYLSHLLWHTFQLLVSRSGR